MKYLLPLLPLLFAACLQVADEECDPNVDPYCDPTDDDDSVADDDDSAVDDDDTATDDDDDTAVDDDDTGAMTLATRYVIDCSQVMDKVCTCYFDRLQCPPDFSACAPDGICDPQCVTIARYPQDDCEQRVYADHRAGLDALFDEILACVRAADCPTVVDTPLMQLLGDCAVALAASEPHASLLAEIEEEAADCRLYIGGMIDNLGGP